MEEKNVLNVKDLQAMGFSRTMAYRLLHRADLPVVRIGDRYFMHREGFMRWLEEQARHEPAV